VSLRVRLLLASFYILTVVVAALEIPLALNIEQRATREFEAGVLSNAVLLAARINDDVPRSGTDPSRTPTPPAAIARIVGKTARSVRPAIRFVVTDQLGRVLADSAGALPVGSPFGSTRREFVVALSKPGGTIDITHRYSRPLRQDLLLIAVPVVHNHEAIGVVRASEPTGTLAARVHRIWVGLAGIGVAVLVVGLSLAWLLATTLARPVRRLEDAAARLGSGQLDARAEAGGPKEIATLARSFNAMASALSANIAAQRGFLANASHQLRTPLTGLKLRLEDIARQGGPQAEQALKAEAEADRLNELVDGLLVLARASSAPTAAASLDLSALVRAARERWDQAAAHAGKHLESEAPDGTLAIRADQADLGHILDNLIENAIRYTPRGTAIVVRAGRAGDGVTLSVRDDGPGIPAADRAQVFERFYRGTSGVRTGPGSGLGLAIVSECVQRWGGTIELLDGPGTTFVATFPRAAPAAPHSEAVSRPAVP
jgi:signal transduction histidine kinase